MPTAPLDPTVVLGIDGYLRPNIPSIVQRHNSFRRWKDTFELHEGGWEKFTRGYEKFGLNVGPNNEVIYREWAPNAKEAYLIGEFSEQHTSALPETPR
jgi:1,4-alpha-glucan branching enzyme